MKKLLAVLLCSTMVVGMLAACGSSASSEPAAEPEAEAEAEAEALLELLPQPASIAPAPAIAATAAPPATNERLETLESVMDMSYSLSRLPGITAERTTVRTITPNHLFDHIH